MPRLRPHGTQVSEWLPTGVETTWQPTATSCTTYSDLEWSSEDIPTSEGSNMIIAPIHPVVMIRTSPPAQSFMPVQCLEQSIVQAFRTYKPLSIERSKIQQARVAGVPNLIHHILRFEREQRGFNPDYIEQIACRMFTILLAVDARILSHHISGDFVRPYLEDRSFKDLIDSMSERAGNEQPAVYRVTIADQFGNGHNADELARCLLTLEHYIYGYLDPCTIYAIDNFHEVDSNCTGPRQRFGKFILNAHGLVSESRQIAMQAFIDNTRHRHEAYQTPLSYVGVTTRPQSRRKEHEEGSIKIMSLFHAISTYWYHKKFQAHYHTLFLCFAPAHGVAAEILFERLGCGTIATGGGFASYPAGTSVASMTRYSDEAWADWTDYAMSTTPYLRNLTMWQHDSIWTQVKQMDDQVRRRLWVINRLSELFGNDTFQLHDDEEEET